jgi:hypothetical protein
MKYAWQRQTKDFGHTNGHQYSCLVTDNRGIGDSDKPTSRYSTSEMAKDLIEVIDHIGWTGKRELHIIGISMGGMIAQEMVSHVFGFPSSGTERWLSPSGDRMRKLPSADTHAPQLQTPNASKNDINRSDTITRPVISAVHPIFAHNSIRLCPHLFATSHLYCVDTRICQSTRFGR